MLYNMMELLEVADKNNFAIPAFNVSDFAMFNGIMDVSERMCAPVICEIHPNELKHIGTDFIKGMISRAEASPLPVVIHLDHGATLANCMVAIRAGFTSVMIDASALPFEENVARTKQVVDLAHSAITYTKVTDDSDPRKAADLKDRCDWHYAPSYHAMNVSVEAELGTIGVINEAEGTVDMAHIKYTNPDDAVRFAQETGVDCLAIAIGTCHGAYPHGQQPDLKIDVLKAIKKAFVDNGIKTKLVLHGGSGNKVELLKEAARSGINKINISTDIKFAYYNKMYEILNADYDPEKKALKTLREPNAIQPECIKALEEVAAERIDWFGAAGKAKLY
ncbi:MAG: class II fructose-bisphosphate aldolase [Porcincola intestinalis]|jgi:fructose-bisphosphate aldolase class II|uniref:class II fructose-bisphosphate aldolase n=2 Tax=Porcincola intestinalis TaxID=2606632 RepID=UPI002A91C5B7|nr:class II fructose-bisphosphate aldolase [Porcincola intestinalis]MCI6766374.1 class II fructose-bisphosphate aldolase [Lachnospiraceae bacterium]MDD7059492.1 class II fructose-bisphosphate aldolase [Porcincola intestinalis]MDY5283740.1 class II fructose-bisphosphate aldolase [Porcincola intestinalis]